MTEVWAFQRHRISSRGTYMSERRMSEIQMELSVTRMMMKMAEKQLDSTPLAQSPH